MCFLPVTRRKSWQTAQEELRGQLGEQADRQPDDVGHAALEPLDQGRAEGLDRVAAGAPAPLAESHVALLLLLGNGPEDDRRPLEPAALRALAEDDEAAHHLMGAARHAVEVVASLGLVGGLAES